MVKCNQCGQCCKEEVCYIGERLFDTDKPPCPGLIYKNGKYWCSAVLYGDKFFKGSSALFSNALGIGTFCDGVKK